jgi:putative Mg2+ transporter-C (MgtC) family protein
MEQFYEIVDSLRGAEPLALVVKLLFSVFFGGIIGLDRGRKKRAAGFRTHILVCVGATLAMCISRYLVEVLGLGTDVSRLGAQVINGIGFLGAGTIIVTGGQQVKGLTTAAALWASACMGLAIGAGFYECAILACLFIYLTVTLFNSVEKLLTSRTYNMNINVMLTETSRLGDVLAKLKEMNIKIYDTEIINIKDLKHESPIVVIEMRLPTHSPHSQIITTLAAIDGVISVEEP